MGSTWRLSFLLGVLSLAPWSAAVRAQPEPLGGELQINTYTTSIQHDPHVAAAGDGFVVVWRSVPQGGHVFARRYDPAGSPLDPETQVDHPPTPDGDTHEQRVAGNSDGSFVVVWNQGPITSEDMIFMQRFDGSGAALGSDMQVGSSGAFPDDGPAVAALPGDGFVVAWEDVHGDGSPTSSPGIRSRVFDGTGTAVGPEFAVNAYTTGVQERTAVAATGDGFVIVWTSLPGQDGNGEGVFGRRFDATGTPRTSFDFGVNTYTTGAQNSPAVAALQTGDFVVVWQSDGQDGSSYGVFGKRYDSTGNPSGAEFQVNTHTTGFQGGPAITAEDGGGFVVAWSDYSLDGDASSVVVRRFDATGAPAGSEVLVNTYTTGSQGASSVSPAGNGFVVVWQSDGQDGDNGGVFARQFAGPPRVIAGTKLLISDRGDPTKRKVVFVAKDGNIFTTKVGGIDPTVNGASLQIYNANGTGEFACLPLPQTGWSARHGVVTAGGLDAPSYRYKDATFANGPCKVARVKHQKLLKVVCRAATQPIGYTLDEAAQGSVGVRFRSGGTTYCTEFGGTGVKVDKPGKFLGTGTVLFSCPLAPAPCP